MLSVYASRVPPVDPQASGTVVVNTNTAEREGEHSRPGSRIGKEFEIKSEGVGAAPLRTLFFLYFLAYADLSVNFTNRSKQIRSLTIPLCPPLGL